MRMVKCHDNDSGKSGYGDDNSGDVNASDNGYGCDFDTEGGVNVGDEDGGDGNDSDDGDDCCDSDDGDDCCDSDDDFRPCDLGTVNMLKFDKDLIKHLPADLKRLMQTVTAMMPTMTVRPSMTSMKIVP